MDTLSTNVTIDKTFRKIHIYSNPRRDICIVPRNKSTQNKQSMNYAKR